MPTAKNNNTIFSPAAMLASAGERYDSRLMANVFAAMLQEDEEVSNLMARKRLELAEQMHNKPISYSEKSGWYTDVPDPTRPDGRRKIRKATKEKVLEELAVHYIDNNGKPKNLTMAQVYPKWLEWKKTPDNDTTISRFEAIWKAYYAGEPISQSIINKPMDKLTSLELREWAEALLKKLHPVNKKKSMRIFSIINGVFEFAADEDRMIVPDNTWQRARKKINQKLIVPTVTPSNESQVFTDDERRQIKQMVYDDLKKYKNKPTSAGLQILFIFETALRIGECCGLKWSDIQNGELHIQRQANNTGVKESTKTSNGYRVIPLTTEALRILDDVAKYNEEHNLTAEWIFQGNNPKYDYRLSDDAVNNKLRKLCARLGTENKTAHKLRKTALSILMDSDEISKRTVQRFAGHADIATTQRYYSFERRSKEEQAKAIEKALSL